MSKNSRRYCVFISYRHADNLEMGRKWANWLHEALESYEVPPDLVGKMSLRGDRVPASLYPVFRDKEELPADADLSTNIRRSLENSGLLVVLCSPRAVVSRFVEDEIRYFKELGKSDRILALMIDGEPNASDDPAKTMAFGAEAECFPKPLRFGVASDGDAKRIDWNARTEPIAADVRPEGRCAQGWTTAAAYHEQLVKERQMPPRQIAGAVRDFAERLELAKLKIIAGALGVPLGELTQRDKAFQLAKARRRQKIISVLAVVFGVLAVYAVTSALKARSESAMRARLLEDVARADRATAQDLNQRGEVSSSLAYLARAVRNCPSDPAGAQSAVILLNQWPYLAPWNSPDAAGGVVEFSPSGRWIACVKEEAGRKGVALSLAQEPTVRVFLPSPYGEERLGVSFLDEHRLEVYLRGEPPEKMPPEVAATRVWDFAQALEEGGSPEKFLTRAPPASPANAADAVDAVDDADTPGVWTGSGITARDAEGRLTFTKADGTQVQGEGRSAATSLAGGVFSPDGSMFFAAAVPLAEDAPGRTLKAWSTQDGRLRYERKVTQPEDEGMHADLTNGTWYLSPFGDAFAVMDENWLALGSIGPESAMILHVETMAQDEGAYREAVFSPDGAHVGVVFEMRGEDLLFKSAAKIFWTATADLDGETPVRWGFRAGTTNLHWSPDGSLLMLSNWLDAWRHDDVWHAPAATLFAAEPTEGPMPLRVGRKAVMASDEDCKVDSSVPGVTVLKRFQETLATLHGETGVVHGWFQPKEKSEIYVFERRDTGKEGEDELWAGRWALPGGVLQGRKQRVLQNYPGDDLDVMILSPGRQMVIATQGASWIGHADTLATLRVVDHRVISTSPGQRWHVTEEVSRYDDAVLRLVSAATGSETLSFTSGARSVDEVRFERGGRQLQVMAGGHTQSWVLLDAALPPPEWFSDFLSAASFQSFDAKGVLDFPFPTSGQFSARLVADFLADKTEYGEFARWFLQRGSAGARWPDTQETARQMAEKLLRADTPEALHRCYLLDKTTPGLEAALARHAANEVSAELHRRRASR